MIYSHNYGRGSRTAAVTSRCGGRARAASPSSPPAPGTTTTRAEPSTRSSARRRWLLSPTGGATLSDGCSNLCVVFTANDAYMRDYASCPADCVPRDPPGEPQALGIMRTLLKADSPRPLARLGRLAGPCRAASDGVTLPSGSRGGFKTFPGARTDIDCLWAAPYNERSGKPHDMRM